MLKSTILLLVTFAVIVPFIQTATQENIVGERHSLWQYYDHREWTMFVSMIFLFAIMGCIARRIYQIKIDTQTNHKIIVECEEEIKTVELGGSEFLISSMRDKREGIKFFKNPARKGGESDNKVNQVRNEINRMKKSIHSIGRDVQNLEQRNKAYEEEASNLKDEYEVMKERGCDIAAAYGFGDVNTMQYNVTDRL